MPEDNYYIAIPKCDIEDVLTIFEEVLDEDYNPGVTQKILYLQKHLKEAINGRT